MPPAPFTTSDIPPEYWEGASLVGSVPFKASSFDQRASYCMYIPKEHYGNNNGLKLPLIVTIHGNGREAGQCRDSLKDLADQSKAAVLAPLFPTGIDDPNDTQNYKRLSYNGIRYDLILLAMIEEVAVRWPGIETEKFFLMGFSGGGQFCLKFFYLYPEKLEAVSIGAPGMVTRLEDKVEWPMGIQGIEDIFPGKEIDLDLIRKVSDIQLIVGGDDVKSITAGFLEWICVKKGIPLPVLPNRRDALSALHEEFGTLGIKSKFFVVDGVRHDALGVLATVVEFMEPLLTKWHGSRQ